MTDSTQSRPGIVEQRLPLGIGWAQMGLDGWLVPTTAAVPPPVAGAHPGQQRLLP